MFLSSTVSNAESCHNFVKHQNCSILITKLAEALKEFLGWRNESRVSNNRLKDNSSNFIFVVLKDLFYAFNVIILGAKSSLGCCFWDSWRVWETKCSHTRSSLYEEGISMTVIASLKFDNFLPLCVRADKTNHSHARLGSRVGKANHLHRRNSIDDHFRKNILEDTRSTEGSSLLHCFFNLSKNSVICMTNNSRTPGSHVVNVLVSINVPCISTFNSVEYNWFSPNGFKSTDR
mmetsp:Transcript_10182/g.15233  ORF Transcript_10182/g.15233 Transcript_10182/m.15233 type:complete len:233 (+) Transcript_10182:688-1386(+)